MSVSRERLYEEIWAEPALTVAMRYGVSSSFLARVCQRLNVPRPARGYWAKLAAGKKQRRLPLPETRVGDETEWLRPGEGPTAPPPELRPPDPEAPRSPPRPRAPDARHPLVVGVRGRFDVARVDRYGRLRPRRSLLVDVYVSKDTLGKALRTANALFLELEGRGHRVVMPTRDNEFYRPPVDADPRGPSYDDSWTPKRPTIAYLGTVAIGLTLFELTGSVLMRLSDGKWVRVPQRVAATSHVGGWNAPMTRTVTNGLLCLRATCPYGVASWERRWSEVKRGELLSKVKEIATELEGETPALVKLVEEGERLAERQRKEREEQYQKYLREEQERRRQENIKAARTELMAAIQAWGALRNIEAFFASVEAQTASLPDDERAVILDRLARGRALIGPIDALQRLREWVAPEERSLERRWY